MATSIITALFNSRADADRAQERLHALGIAVSDVRVIDRSSPDLPRTDEHRDGNTFMAALKEFLLPHEDPSGYADALRRGGCVLCTKVVDSDADRAIGVLKESHAMRVDRQAEDWPPQKWMGTHDGRVTGTAVPPGQGDAETSGTAVAGGTMAAPPEHTTRRSSHEA